MSDKELKGKPVTVVYRIEDVDEWSKTNPMKYKHNGLVAYGCSASDLMARCESLETGLRIIAGEEEDNDGFESPEEIAKHYLKP